MGVERMNKMDNKKFMIYEKIRQSGLTNMFDIKDVKILSGNRLTKEDCLDIMNNYGKYKERSNSINEVQ